MPLIIPAILEETKPGFLQKLSLIMKIPGVERVQVDFGDGIFIPTKLLGPEDIDALNPTIHWEAHLMVKEPSDFLDYQICGFKTLIIHYEAFASVEGLKKTLADIKSMGFKASVAINPDTQVSVLNNIEADQYLIMSVVPGKQGQAFIESTPGRVQELRKLKPNAIIEVDGGVNLNTIKLAADVGVDLIVAGSAIVGNPNPAEAYEKLTHAAQASS
jgi:ribulose-phosphate 3-epimerase